MSSDEWEYEYDAHETEDLYFTLDLTTHVPDALVEKPPSAFGSAKSKSAPKTPNTTTTDQNGDEDDDDSDDSEEDEAAKLQIIDLHTSNPLIKFDEAVYSCYWTTDLGTQFHITQAGQSTNPLRKGTILDVLGITRARLLGKPVKLQDRNAKAEPQPAAKAPTPEEDLLDAENQINPGPLQIPRAQLKTAKSRGQASFLERLSAIKQSKGEMDQVPIIAVKQYTAPADAAEIKRKAEEDDRNNSLERRDGKKRRRRRPLGSGPLAGNAGRHGRDVTARRLGIVEDGGEGVVRTGMFGAGGVVGSDAMGLSSPQGRHWDYGRLEDPGEATASPSGINRELAGQSGGGGQADYLTYQSREEYYESVRRDEGSPVSNLQPTRPPWMAEAAAEEAPVEEPVD